MADKICSFPDCGKKYLAKGLCRGHYSQQDRGLELAPLNKPKSKKPERFCSFEGCDRIHASLGYCDAHYRQIKRGDTLSIIKTELSNEDKECSFVSCTNSRMALGLCAGHYAQKRKGKDLTELRTSSGAQEIVSSKICYFDACDKKVSALGLCSGHYSQKIRGKELSTLGSLPRIDATQPKNCEFCTDEFLPKSSRSRFCSRSCSAKNQRSPIRKAADDNNSEEFMRLVRENSSVDTETDCWNWLGRLDHNGYPNISGKASSRFVHRLVIEVGLGHKMGSDEAHHICANRKCLNPDHLQAISKRENLAEMRQRRTYIKRIQELEDIIKELDPENPILNRSYVK